jgi:hypothetical protein
LEANYEPGTVPGGVAGPAVSSWGASAVGASLNGIFSYVDAGYQPAFTPTNQQPFSAQLWFKGNPADSSLQALMSCGSNSWSLNLNGANGEIVWNSGAGTVSTSTSYNDGNWHQATAVYDGANNKLYLDGSLAGTATASGTPTAGTSDLYLGGDPTYTSVGVNERFFGGAIAQAAFYTNALTAPQIQTTYQAAIAPPPPVFSAWQESGNQLNLSWTYGTLQTATNVTGPYLDVPTAVAPYPISTTNRQQFYRLRSN